MGRRFVLRSRVSLARNAQCSTLRHLLCCAGVTVSLSACAGVFRTMSAGVFRTMSAFMCCIACVPSTTLPCCHAALSWATCERTVASFCYTRVYGHN